MSAQIDLPYFALRILNNQDISEGEIDKFTIEFLDEYLRNEEYRNSVEGKYVIFVNGKYKEVIDDYDLNDWKILSHLRHYTIFLVEISKETKKIRYSHDIVYEFSNDPCFLLNDRKHYKIERFPDDYPVEKMENAVRSSESTIVKFNCGISFKKVDYSLTKVRNYFIYDLGSENVHILGGKFFHTESSRFILDDTATEEEIEMYENEFPEWNKRIVATSPAGIEGTGDIEVQGLILFLDPPLYLCLPDLNPTPCSRFLILMKKERLEMPRKTILNWFRRNNYDENQTFILRPLKTVKNYLFGLPGIQNYKTEIYKSISGNLVIKIKNYTLITKPDNSEKNYIAKRHNGEVIPFSYNILDPYERQELFEIFRIDENFQLYFLNNNNNSNVIKHDMKFGVTKEIFLLQKYNDMTKYSYITKEPLFLVRIRDISGLENYDLLLQNIISCNYIDGYISNSEDEIGNVEIYLKEPHRLIRFYNIIEDNSFITDKEYQLNLLQKEQDIINDFIHHSVDCDINFNIIEETLDLRMAPTYFLL